MSKTLNDTTKWIIGILLALLFSVGGFYAKTIYADVESLKVFRTSIKHDFKTIKKMLAIHDPKLEKFLHEDDEKE